MMLKNETVKLSEPTPALALALVHAELLHKRYTGWELVITSGNDGEHMEFSKHYTNEAADLRIWALRSIGAVERFVRELARTLGPEYDIVQYDTHIHMEYDPK